ncbi:MAG TPA: hypothetical protein VIF43_03410 [Patescibacteria group bacterium]
MDWFFRQLDSTPKRVLAAAAVAIVIVLAVSTFAQTSYVQTQKIQIESAAGKHCKEWSYRTVDGDTRVTCEQLDY